MGLKKQKLRLFYIFSRCTIFGIKGKQAFKKAESQRVSFRELVRERDWLFFPHAAKVPPRLFISNLLNFKIPKNLITENELTLKYEHVFCKLVE